MLVIRKATKADVPTIFTLVKALAEYEREPHAVIATEADFERDGFGDDPAFEVLLADWDGRTVGFAFYFFTYSTWRGRRKLFLEDLFVVPDHRKKGIGIALMKALAREALRADCRSFVWQVLEWNTPSIAFYEKLGAKVLRDWLYVHLDGEALASLAK